VPEIAGAEWREATPDERRPEMQDANQKLCSYRDAARALGVSTETVRRLVARDEMRTVRIGRSVRIPVADIDALVSRDRVVTRPAE